MEALTTVASGTPFPAAKTCDANRTEIAMRSLASRPRSSNSCFEQLLQGSPPPHCTGQDPHERRATVNLKPAYLCASYSSSNYAHRTQGMYRPRVKKILWILLRSSENLQWKALTTATSGTPSCGRKKNDTNRTEVAMRPFASGPRSSSSCFDQLLQGGPAGPPDRTGAARKKRDQTVNLKPTYFCASYGPP